MKAYSTNGVLAPEINDLLLVKRDCMGRTRHGVMMCIDLEAYDFHAGSSSLVRASEKTIESRLPPRVDIRRDAVYELPHVLVLVDDPERSIVEPLIAAKDSFEQVYDFDLMKNGGHLASWKVTNDHLEKFTAALEANVAKESFVKRYGEEAREKPAMLFAVGDGNHSLNKIFNLIQS